MKKLVSTVIAFALLMIATVFFASPAQASDIDKKSPVCQATGNGTYHLISVNENSLVNGNGSISGINANDVVPPFDFNFGGSNYGHFAGHNWPSEDIGKAFMAGCAGKTTEVTPTLASPTVQATCVNVQGEKPVAPAQTDPNVTAGEAVFSNGVWTIEYSKPENITHNTPITFESFVWAAMRPVFNGVQTITVLPAGPGDELWDVKTGSCRTPDTGGGISNTALMFGGIAIGLGMVFLGITSIMKRRESK
ncbi:hypothetical protein PBI_MIMI_189 [Arthrobacter phage Mimi]|nr:hypothetical protein PBI_MIMI_269 [Arthrobacter phage Mimi]